MKPMSTLPIRRHPRRGQVGTVLVIGLVLLVMLTLVAVSLVRLTTRHTRVTNNEQVRTEATTAAHYALDMVLNQPLTQWDPYKGSAGATAYVNLGTSSTGAAADQAIKVVVNNLSCTRSRIIKNSELYKKDASGVVYVGSDDTSCFGGGGSSGLTIVDPGAAGTSAGDSLCATVLYEFQARADDPKLLEATPAPVMQGVEVRTDITTVVDACK